MLTIIDYGVGNLRSVYMAFRRLGLEVRVVNRPADLGGATALVLPGVGAFGDAMASLRALKLDEPIIAAVREGMPFLGICLGLQLLFEVSEEMGEHRGLGLIGGRVKRFPPHLTVPHMGWNQIHQAKACALWRGVPDHAYAYFVHSYYAEAEEKDVVAAWTDYGIDYVSAIAQGNLYAIQFHPEKSQDVGERILRNFCIAAGLLQEEG
ncbi:MAG: imidazole glycerol phosphate synthase subunit HisH [Chloroflexi bacterium]|nr:imidazole glycerol phosphate synthase subunit HisH [Chloroflexota bacterium]